MAFFFSVREISEVEGTTTLKISLKRRWVDERLAFSSFEPGRSSVKISPDERETLWVPWTVFANMKDGKSWVKSDVPDQLSANFAKDYNSSANVHVGADIVIEYEREMIVELMCEYNMFWFPFDSQTCGVEMYQKEENVILIPSAVAYTGPPQLIQYTVMGIEMCPAFFQVKNNHNCQIG